MPIPELIAARVPITGLIVIPQRMKCSRGRSDSFLDLPSVSQGICDYQSLSIPEINGTSTSAGDS